MEITQIQPMLGGDASSPETGPSISMRDHHRTTLDRASMAELVTFGRLFHAAINCRHCPDEETAHRLDDEMDVLSTVDDEISELIIERRPMTAADYVTKAAYLLERTRSDSMSSDVMDAALSVLIADTSVLSEGLRGAGGGEGGR